MVEFRHIAVSDGQKTASGFMLCYESEEESNVLFEVLKSGYNAKIEKRTYVSFLSDIAGYSLSLPIKENTFA